MPAIVRRRLAYVVLGHVAAYLVALGYHAGWSDFPVVVLFLSEQSLLYIWAVLRKGDWRGRVIRAYLLSAFSWVLPAVFGGVPIAASGITGCVVSLLLLPFHVVPLGFARSNAYQLQRFSPDGIPERKPFQVSLRSMFLATLALACLLALATFAGDDVELQGFQIIGMSGFSAPLLFVGLPAFLTSSALLSVWAALSVGNPIGRTFAGTVAAAVGGAYLPFCLNGDAWAYAFWPGLTASFFLVISASLLTFRGAGYRFVWRDPLDDDSLAENAVSSETDGR